MQVLLAVVEDLYTFAVSLFSPHRREPEALQIQPYHASARALAPLPEVVGCEGYGSDVGVVETEHALEDVEDFFDEEDARAADDAAFDEMGALFVEPEPVSAERATVFAEPQLFPQKHTIVYCAQASVPLRTTPDETADSAIATVRYGDLIMVLEAAGDYLYVAAGDKKGYLPSAALAQKAADVYPAFIIGGENPAHESTTARLRLVIRDEFSAGLSQSPLGAHEYVYYKLLRRGARIFWPDIRPRTPGTWARILSPLAEVTVGDVPTTGSVMEFTLPEGKAHLAYVEKVFPDGTIELSEANWPDRGIYNERVLVAEEWRALNPAFITVR